MQKPKHKIGEYVWFITKGKLKNLQIVGIINSSFDINLTFEGFNGIQYKLMCVKKPILENRVFRTLKELLQSLCDSYEDDIEIDTNKHTLEIKTYYK